MPTPVALLLLLLLSGTAFASPQGRFFLEGDGLLHVVNAKSGAGGPIRYRLPDGSYPAAAVGRINRIFGVPAASPNTSPENSSEGISLRLVSLLDYLQDHFGGGVIRIVSGYRSPASNERLRQRGKLAARTSLHLEGMAADIEMAEVAAEGLWNFVRQLDCCGVGYYHGNGVHIDTGPSRFWDETSTKVEQDLGAHNKLVLLRTDQDLYRPGETVRLSLHRITDYPFGVKAEGIVAGCFIVSDRKVARSFRWRIPEGLRPKEKMRIRFDFCQKPFPEMPDGTESNPIQILGSE